MQQHTPYVNVVTLAVDDLPRALAFYRDGMGWQSDGIIGQEFEHGSVAFFPMRNNLTLALFPAPSLAHDAHVEVTKHRVGAVSIGYLAATQREVDEIIERAGRAGATVTDPPSKRFWGGYSGYFQDLDGHLWEVLWHPKWSKQLPAQTE